MSTDRALLEVKAGSLIDLTFTSPDKSRMRDLLAVPISLLKELNNFRVLLIREGEQARFDQVTSLSDLRKFSAGLGAQWPDTEIMRSNGFQVETSLQHQSLFKMLTVRRFDFFPRGIYEVQDEIRAHKDEGLAIETHLFLYYEVPFYFFVNKNRPELAARIEAGLKLAQADGSVDRLLMSYPAYEAAIKLQTNSGRKLLKLKPLSPLN